MVMYAMHEEFFPFGQELCHSARVFPFRTVTGHYNHRERPEHKELELREQRRVPDGENTWGVFTVKQRKLNMRMYIIKKDMNERTKP